MNCIERHLAVTDIFIISEKYWHLLILVLRFTDVTANKILFGKVNWIININDKRHLNSVFKWLILKHYAVEITKKSWEFLTDVNAKLLFTQWNINLMWRSSLLQHIYQIWPMFSTNTFKSNYVFLKNMSFVVHSSFFKILSWQFS